MSLLQLPSTFNFASDVVDVWAEDPELLALIAATADGTIEKFTYADIRDLSRRLATMLERASVRKGDRVIIMLPRRWEWVVAMITCARMGCVPVPCITMLTSSDIAYRVKHSGARVAVTEGGQAHKFADLDSLEVKVAVDDVPLGWLDFHALSAETPTALPADVGIDEPAIMYYTSGSTGGPKGVLHAARALFAWRVSAEHWLTVRRGEVIWCTADTGWSKAGTSILYGPFSRGATTVLYDGPFEPHRRFDLIRTFRAHVFCAAATELRRLILEPAPGDLGVLRLAVSAGETVNPEVVERWKELTGIDVLDGYGQTETLMTVTNSPGMTIKPGSMGRALPGVEIGVLTADGEVNETSSSGQLVIRMPNPQLMIGYSGEPERTDACYTEVHGTKWFMTGDNVEIDDEGYVFYLGRSDDIINSSGYRIGPQEVENTLVSHPKVQECAVVAQPDPDRGEIVVAFVVLAPGETASEELIGELQNYVKQQTAPYKYPRRVLFVSDLPKTVSGKIRRNELRKQLIADQ